jgi:hypothetical protein
MPAAHIYPDQSASNPTCMFGSFDLDDADAGSALGLGEALLRVKKEARTVAAAHHIHHYAGSANGATSAFMLGTRPEQIVVAVPDEMVLNLWATEQT